MNWPMIIFAVLIIIVFIGRPALENNLSNRLVTYVYNQDYKSYEKLRNSKLTSFLIRQYNLRFLDLSAAMSKGNDQEIRKCVENLDRMILTPRQAEAIYGRCFSYYLALDNFTEAKKYYQKVKDNKGIKDTFELDRFYDIYIENGYKYLNKTLEEYDSVSEEIRPNYDAMLAKMYANKGDKTNAEYYRKKTDENMKKLQMSLKDQTGL